MKTILFTLLALIICCKIGYSQEYKKSIIEYQKELNREFNDPNESPLKQKDRKKFEGLNFYPIDEKYKVIAKFERVQNAIPFKMITTTDRLPTYEVYAIATFVIDQQEYKLNIYQSHDLRKIEKLRTHLFLPFTDLTNGEETYGGGRFIDLEIPEDEQIVIDFNKAYNPYCAYNSIYSCPIPPKENDLKIQVLAGVKL